MREVSYTVHRDTKFFDDDDDYDDNDNDDYDDDHDDDHDDDDDFTKSSVSLCTK